MANSDQPQVKRSHGTHHSQKFRTGTDSSIMDGTRGTHPFQKKAAARTFQRQLPKAVGALAAVATVFIFWPFGTVEGSNFAHSVPHQDTAAAKLSLDGSVKVDLPQTYAHLDKPKDDDE